MQRRTAFVTGATGFLGSFLVTALLERGYRVVALVRGPDARERLLEILHDVSDGQTLLHNEEQLQVVEGDVRSSGFGLTEDIQHALAHEVDEIWHCATSFKFQERDREKVFSHNVTGAKNLLEFARRCNDGKEAPLFYVSTAYAAPMINGQAAEDLAPSDVQSRNLYEWSKQEAERLVDQYRREYGLPVSIFRPSIIVGHSHTGKAIRFSGYYDVFRAFALLVRSLEVNLGSAFDRNLHIRVRAQADTPLNMIPVDFVVEAMLRLASADRRDAFIFNIVNENPVPVADLFRHACEELRVTGVEFVGEDSFQKRPMTTFERLFDRRTRFQAPYLLDGPLFRTGHFRSLVSQQILPCPPVDAVLMGKVNQYYLGIIDQQFAQPNQAAVPATPEPPVSACEFTVPTQVEKSFSERLKEMMPWWTDHSLREPLGNFANRAFAS